MGSQSFLAKALFDNLAESPDELAFRRGDILSVLEVDTEGLEGWYLCRLRNKQGIAPGNRLKILTGMKVNPTTLQSSSRTEALLKENLQRSSTNRYYNGSSQVLDYDVPPSQQGFPFTSHEKYNKSSYNFDYDVPKGTATQGSGSSKCSASSKEKRNTNINRTPITASRCRERSMTDNLDYDSPKSRFVERNLSDNEDLDYDKPLSSNLARVGYTKQISPDGSSYLSLRSSPTRSSWYSTQSDSLSGHLTSGIGSSCSSFDINAHDYYDIPPIRDISQRDSGVEQDFSLPRGDGSGKALFSRETPHVPLVNKNPVVKTGMRLSSEDLDYDSPRTMTHGPASDCYDYPKGQSSVDDEYDTPLTPKNIKTSKGKIDDLCYDVPQGNIGYRESNISGLSDVFHPLTRRNDSVDSIGNVSVNVSMDEDSTLSKVTILQDDIKCTADCFLSRVKSTWRQRDEMDQNRLVYRDVCKSLMPKVKNYMDLVQNCLTVSTKTADQKLTRSLYLDLQQLQGIYYRLHNSIVNLDQSNWNLDSLVEQRYSNSQDNIGIILNCTKTLLDCTAATASLITENSIVLSKTQNTNNKADCSTSKDHKPIVAPKPKVSSPERRPLPNPPYPNNVDAKDDDTLKRSKELYTKHNLNDIVDEYDYVHLSRKNTNRTSYDDNTFGSYSEIPSSVSSESPLQSKTPQFEENDQRILKFYSKRIDDVTDQLSNNVDCFFTCIEHNNLPNIFVAQTKLVILSAHKLVYIGDTLHHNLINIQVREQVLSQANKLCDLLKESVTATKSAALNHLHVPLMQDMVEKIVKVSQAAKQIRAYVANIVSGFI